MTIRHVLALIVLLATVVAATPVRAIETAAREAVVIDMSTGSILLEKGARDRMPTASMSKIMTMYMVFEALEQGRLKLDDELTVSERAWRMGGSKMFVEVGKRVRVDDLIRGIIIQSGNDACIVLAEALAGSEEAFAEQMNRKAAELGLTGSHFMNSTGWPDPDHYSTPMDLALLAYRIIADYPQHYHYFAETEFTFNGIRQENRDPLLGSFPGADGLKTGHTEEAGYGLVGSAIRDGRRIILVIGGLTSMAQRREESIRLMEWAYREFDSFRLFSGSETVAEAKVWMGAAPTVPMVVGQDLAVTVPRASRDQMQVKVTVDQPVPAPIKAGDQIGMLTVTFPDLPVRTLPLLAGESVDRAGIVGRIGAALNYLVLGSGV